MAGAAGVRRGSGRFSLIRRGHHRAGARPALLAKLGLTALSLALGLSGGCFAREMRVSSDITVDHPAFAPSIAGINGREFHANNQLELITSGSNTFARIFEMIATAKHSINLEFFLYNSDRTGEELADRLIQRAREGVAVNMVVDAVGGFYFEDETMQRLRDGGVRVHLYNSWNYFAMWQYRVRTHRRIIVVDGQRGLVGGFGVTNWWRNPAGYGEYDVYDLAAYLEGPAVAQLQMSFLENWKEITDEVLTGPLYFPVEVTVPAKESTLHSSTVIRNTRLLAGSTSPQRQIPRESTSKVYEAYLFAIESSRRSIQIFTPFLVPDQPLADALVRARSRGVQVTILTPHPRFIVETPVIYAGRNYFEQLLKAGVRILYFDAGLLHSKGVVFDGRYAIVGTTNFDQRSFKINAENDLHIYDARAAARLAGIVRTYELKSVEYTLEDFYERGAWSRTWECLWTPLEHEF